MTGAALVRSPDVAALEGLKPNEVDAALAAVWPTYARRTLADAWGIARALRDVKNGRTGRAFRDYLDKIQMGRAWAYRLLQLADGYATLAELSGQRSVQGAVKALAAPVYSVDPTPAPSRNDAQVAAADGDGAPVEPVEAAPVDPDPDPAAVVEAVAASVVDPAADREARLERWAIRTESEDGTEIERLNAIIDRKDERHRADVAAGNADRRARQAAERKFRDMADALLSAPGCPTCADALAKFAGVQRPAA